MKNLSPVGKILDANKNIKKITICPDDNTQVRITGTKYILEIHNNQEKIKLEDDTWFRIDYTFYDKNKKKLYKNNFTTNEYYNIIDTIRRATNRFIELSDMYNDLEENKA